MASVPLLDELAIVAGLAVLVSVVLARLRLPTVAGLLLAGAIAGPFGLRLIRSVHSIEVLADVGVVLLLFTIGLEFSLARLRHIFRQVAVGGLLQIALTTAVVAAVAVALGQGLGRGVFFGFVFALSSTAIVLRALTERGELDAPHGRFIVGTLIFQDLCVVPMVLVIPLLKSGANPVAAAMQIGLALGKAAALVVVIVALARFAVPWILRRVDASRSREVFLLAILGLCIGTAWLTSRVGLSLALGAFLGGMLVADTEYGHRALGDMLPLRDAFVSVFFVSLGMLFDVRVLGTAPLQVGLALAGFLVLKGFLAAIAAMVMKFPARAAWLAGVGLAQFSEFSFVLARLGESHGLVDAATMRPVLAAGVISMFLTPLLVRAAPRLTAGERLLAPLERLLGVRSIGDDPAAGEATPSGHVVLVGFGVAGRLAARALAACEVPYVVLELNAETVRAARAAGLPVYYADATSVEALGHSRLADARALVLLINDPSAVARVVDAAARCAPNVPVLARTRYLSEREQLLRMGARDAVAEEVEGAVEVIARLLRWVEVPRTLIDEQLEAVRAGAQATERTQTVPRPTLGDQHALSDLKIESALVRPGSPAAGRSVLELDLRARTGALVVALRRGERLQEEPDPATRLEVDDVVYLVGTREAMAAALPLFKGP